MSPRQQNRFVTMLLPAVLAHAAHHWSGHGVEEREERNQSAAAIAWKIYVSAVERRKDGQVHCASLITVRHQLDR